MERREPLLRLGEIDEQRHRIDEAIADQRVLLAEMESALEDKDRCIVDDAIAQRLDDAARRLRKEIDIAKRYLRALDKEANQIQDDVDQNFNPWWGRLLTELNELSRFGAQVELYADTYT